MWDPPGPGLEPVSPELAGRFPTTEPPGKPYNFLLYIFILIKERKQQRRRGEEERKRGGERKRGREEERKRGRGGQRKDTWQGPVGRVKQMRILRNKELKTLKL